MTNITILDCYFACVAVGNEGTDGPQMFDVTGNSVASNFVVRDTTFDYFPEGGTCGYFKGGGGIVFMNQA